MIPRVKVDKWRSHLLLMTTSSYQRECHHLSSHTRRPLTTCLVTMMTLRNKKAPVMAPEKLQIVKPLEGRTVSLWISRVWRPANASHKNTKHRIEITSLATRGEIVLDCVSGKIIGCRLVVVLIQSLRSYQRLFLGMDYGPYFNVPIWASINDVIW